MIHEEWSMQSFRFDKSSFWPSLPKSQVIFFLACHKPFIDDRFLLVEGLWTYMVNCTSGWSIYSPLCNFKLIPGFYFEITQCRLTWLAWSVTQHVCLQAFNQSKTNTNRRLGMVYLVFLQIKLLAVIHLGSCDSIGQLWCDLTCDWKRCMHF